MLSRIKGKKMMHTGHQNKYDSVLRSQWWNDTGRVRKWRRLNSHLTNSSEEQKFLKTKQKK